MKGLGFSIGERHLRVLLIIAWIGLDWNELGRFDLM